MQKKENFWKNLQKPFSVLAPMADVTDPPFRSIIAKYGKPDVMYTQFVSCDGLCSAGYDALIKEFGYTENERPIVAQVFGAKPENFYKIAKLVKKLGFDGIDVNMGCPDKNVMKQNAGASLIKNHSLAKEILLATKEGAGIMPVSIKTRVGDSKNILDSWIPTLLSTKPAAIVIHARTRSQLSKVPANWSYIKQAGELAKNSETLIIGNGDVKTISEGHSLAKENNIDGIMYGRAIFGNPWFFNKDVDKEEISIKEKILVLQEHTIAFEAYYKKGKKFSTMKKHFKSYVEGFSQAKSFREKLMNTASANEVSQLIGEFLKTSTL